MKVLKRLRLTDVVLYKKAEIDLDFVGTTVVRGKNLNVKRGQHRSNGSGKSLLTSALSQVFGYSSPASNSSKRNQHKDLLSKGSEILVELGDADNEYLVMQSLDKKVDYQVVKNGDVLDPKGLKVADTLLREIIPLTDEEWYSFVYLDSRRPFPLHIGTPTQRFDFIANLFQLDQLEEKAKAVNARLKDIKDIEVQRDAFQLQVDDLRSSLPKMDDDVNLDEMDNRLATLHDKRSTLQQQISDLELCDKFSHIEEELETYYAKYGKSAKRVKERLAELTTLHTAYQTYLSTKPLLEKWKNQWAQLSNDAVNPYGELSLEETKERYQAASVKRNKLMAEYHNKKETYDEIELDEEPTPLDEPTTEYDPDRLAVVSAEYKKLVDLLFIKTNAADNETVECGECGASYTGDELERHREKLQRKQAKLKKELAQLTTTKQEWVDYNQNKRQVEQYQRNAEAKSVLKDRLIQLKAEIKEIDVSASEWIEQESARRSLKANKPTLTKVEFDEQEYLDLQKMVNLQRSYQPVAERLSQVDKTLTLDKVKNRLAKVDEEIKTLQQTIPKLKAQQHYIEQNVERIKKLRKRVKQLNAETTDLEDLKILALAYSKKGLRQYLIQHLATAIEQNLNSYSHLLYPEPFEFEFVVGDNQFDILVHRTGVKSLTGEKRNVQTSDVRFLSGAESRAFNLLTALSLLPLIPSTRRLNTIILDEMDSNLDQGARNLLINSFLPMLNEIVPHVIIVTPLDDEYINSRNVYAVKQGDITTLQWDTH